MALLEEVEANYASDESSESDWLDKSLSVWRGEKFADEELKYETIALDIYTAASIGDYDVVWRIINR